jgi:hypothetical protein
MCRLTQTWMLLKGANPDLGGGRGDAEEQERMLRWACRARRRTRVQDFLPLHDGINIGESSTLAITSERESWDCVRAILTIQLVMLLATWFTVNHQI